MCVQYWFFKGSGTIHYVTIYWTFAIFLLKHIFVVMNKLDFKHISRHQPTCKPTSNPVTPLEKYITIYHLPPTRNNSRSKLGLGAQIAKILSTFPKLVDDTDKYRKQFWELTMFVNSQLCMGILRGHLFNQFSRYRRPC